MKWTQRLPYVGQSNPYERCSTDPLGDVQISTKLTSVRAVDAKVPSTMIKFWVISMSYFDIEFHLSYIFYRPF